MLGFKCQVTNQRENTKTGREAIFLRDRADIIKMRLYAVKSKQCGSMKNKYACPEVFLDAVASKLAGTAVLFLNVELLSEFYYNFPRELDLRLGRHLADDEVERFAKEDPKIRKHLDVIRRKELLELVLDKMESLRQIEGAASASSAVGGSGGSIGFGGGGRDRLGSSRQRGGSGGPESKEQKQQRGRWGLF